MSNTFEPMPNYKILNCCYNCEYFDNFYCSKHEKTLCISHGVCSSYEERKSYINNHPDSQTFPSIRHCTNWEDCINPHKDCLNCPLCYTSDSITYSTTDSYKRL